jgi:outer membrane lipoprotein-sorting protein
MSVMKILTLARTLTVLAAIGLSANAFAATTLKPAKLTETDKADVARIEAYLNELKTLTADFMQVSSVGAIARGKFYLARPGKMRFEYEPPTPILMIANGPFLVYYDSQMQETSNIPVDSTPVGFFLADKISLSRDVTITAITRAPNVINVSVRQTSEPDQGELTMVFSDHPLRLEQWSVLDAQHQVTRVALLDVRTGVPLDPKLFIFQDPKDTPYSSH